jgi:hypothetical protein
MHAEKEKNMNSKVFFTNEIDGLHLIDIYGALASPWPARWP